MPHFITQLDDINDDTFAVYSTIVDGLITEDMNAAEMKQWLIDNGYGSWLINDNSDLDHDRYSPEMIESIIKYREDGKEYMYWHPDGFQYVKLSDNWFTLPREAWRNGE